MKIATVGACRPHVIYSVGNKKIGKDTIIVNITAAKDCASLRLGLCQVPHGRCYAMRSEIQYPSVLPCRRRQTVIWDALTPEEIAEDIKAIKAKEERRKNAVPIRYLRLQESGDFRNQADVDKASKVADLLAGVVRVYTYTARRDLNFAHHSPNLVINGSGFMVDNDFHVVTQLQKGPQCRGISGGGCYECYLCKKSSHKVIQELLRSSGGRKAKATSTPLAVTKSDLELDEHGGVPAGEKVFETAPAVTTVGKKKVSRQSTRSPVTLGGIRL